MHPIIKKVWGGICLFGYLHEIFHYTAAKLLGVQAVIHPTYVSYPAGSRTNSQHIFITLAPFLAFSILLCLSIAGWVLNQHGDPDWTKFWLLSAINWIAWMSGCYYDIKAVLLYTKNGQW